jgi:nucleoside-diphosphate-sugar epimerase
MGVTVLVIGSNGQDGSILCDLLDADNRAYIAVSRSETRLPNNSKRGPVDLSKPKEAASFLDEFKPSAIVHLAAVHAPSGSMSRMGDEKFDEMVKCHVDISRNILDWQVENPSSKSIFALSSQMFSADKQEPFINLDSEVNPSTKYGETKAKCWDLIKEYRSKKNIKASGLILFNHTSDRSKPDFLFPELASQLKGLINATQTAITIRDANACVDIHSAYDLGMGISQIIEKNFVKDFIFSSGKYIKVENIIQETLEKLGISQSIEILSTDKTSSGVPLHGDISDTNNLLGWSPIVTPSEILTSMTRGKKYV